METTFSLCGCFQEGQRRLQVESDSFEVSGQTVNKLSAYSAHCVADTVKASPQS